MMDLLLAFVSALLGSCGFAMLLRAPVRSWFSSGLLGGVTYLLYILLGRFMVADVALFLACTLAGIAARFLSRRFRLIGTVYMIMAIVPFVPGYTLYRSMLLIGSGSNAAGLSALAEAMICILMIVLGISVGDFIGSTFRRLTARLKKQA